MNKPQQDNRREEGTPQDRNIDVTRSQNRQAVGAEHGDTERMGNGSDATGSRPANTSQENVSDTSRRNENATGSHGEGQYPRQGEQGSMSDAQGQVGKPGDRPE